jgi:hypothetical protein
VAPPSTFAWAARCRRRALGVREAIPTGRHCPKIDVFFWGFLHLLSATPSELQGEVHPQTDLLSRASVMRSALVFALLVAATQVSFLRFESLTSHSSLAFTVF